MFLEDRHVFRMKVSMILTLVDPVLSVLRFLIEIETVSGDDCSR